MIKLAVFDFDSTLMDGETIDLLAADYGVGEEVSLITELAMQGELDFFESLMRRVALLKGMPEKRVLEICHNLPYMNGAKNLIQALRQQDMQVICFSGGFRPATRQARQALGLNADFANLLHAKNGELTGLVGGDMMFSQSKGDMLERIQSLLNITKSQTMAVGDGANDLSMFACADTRIAFCAKPALQKEATHCINEKDLTLVLEHLST